MGYYRGSGALPKSLRLERTAARMREQNRGVIALRAFAREQPRTPDGRRFASRERAGAATIFRTVA